MLDLETHRFQGTSSDYVLIVAGIHTSEQSGIEVARWILSQLQARDSPTRLSALVIPEVFPDRAAAARTDEFAGRPIDRWREDIKETRGLYKRRGGTKDPIEIKVARQFPPPGKPLSILKDNFLKNASGANLKAGGANVPLLPEIAYLIRVIEALKPVRIVSVHGKAPRSTTHLEKARKRGMIAMSDDEIKSWDGRPIRGVNFAGVFVDPRYAPLEGGSLEESKFDPKLDPAFPLEGVQDKKRFDSAKNEKEGRSDDALCLALAKTIGGEDKSLVPGNHLFDADDPKPIVHYAREDDDKDNPGYSLGDWGPVEVKPDKDGTGARPGAPVFTIEVNANPESWAFWDRQQMVTEDGKPLPPSPTPSERASGKTPKALANPKFKKDRSKALQTYAKAIVDTILA
jgi:hypothetical protein